MLRKFFLAIIVLGFLVSSASAESLSSAALSVFKNSYQEIDFHKKLGLSDCNIVLEAFPKEPKARYRYLVWKYCSLKVAYSSLDKKLDIYVYDTSGVVDWFTKRYAYDGGPLGEFFAKHFPDLSLSVAKNVRTAVLPVKWRELSPEKILREASPPFAEIDESASVIHLKAVSLKPAFRYSIFVPFDGSRTVLDAFSAVFKEVVPIKYKNKLYLKLGDYSSLEEASKRFSYSLAYFSDLVLEREKEGKFGGKFLPVLYKNLKKILAQGRPVQYRPREVLVLNPQSFVKEYEFKDTKSKVEELKVEARKKAQDLLKKLLERSERTNVSLNSEKASPGSQPPESAVSSAFSMKKENVIGRPEQKKELPDLE